MPEFNQSPHQNHSGRHEQRYRLLNVIGQGGMGIVYRALDRLSGQEVALKQLRVAPGDLDFTSHSSFSNTGAAALALATEFRTLAGLRHPNIVSVLDYGFTTTETDSHQPFFTMQYLANARTLTEYAGDRTLATQVHVLVEVLQALAYLHRRGIIHRDLKPANVLVSTENGTDDVVKVMDFGLALNLSGHSDRHNVEGVVGTLTYIAPELFVETRASVQSDLYAVGLMAYEILTGRPPFSGENPITLVQQILNQTPDTSMLEAPLARVLDRLLAKQPENRYRSADEVIEALCQATGQPVPVENAALLESVLQAAEFVGRDQELTALMSAFRQAEQGTGTAWLIGGESGVGKSRLLDELRTRALVSGALVVRGQAVEGGGLPYQLWRGAVRRLVLGAELSDIEAGILKEIVPDLAALLERSLPEIPVMEGRPGQQRLAQTLIALLRRQSVPVALLLEDLQWSAESMALLKLILPRLAELPLLVIGSYRDDEASTLPGELPGIPVLKLSRLSDDAIAELSASMLGESGSQPAVVELLRRETEGNAFFMVEVVRTLAESAGRLTEVGRSSLPESVFAGGVQQVIKRRVARVPDSLQSLLKLTAVIGRQPDPVLLRRLIASPAELEQFLTVSANAAVLEPAGGGDQRWRFSHDKIRAFVLSQLSDPERLRLHRQVAEAIEAVYPGDETYAGVLAEHWRQADDAVKATHYACLAAGQLFRLGSLPAARALLERTLTLTGGEAQHATLLKMLGDIAERMGDYDRAVDAYQRSLTLATTPAETGRTLIGLSWVTWEQGDAAKAHEYALQSLELCRQADDQRGISRLYGILGILAAESGDFVTAEAYFQQGLALQQQIDDRRGVSVSYQNLGQLAMMRGDNAAAQAHLQNGLKLQREMGDLRGIVGSLQNLAGLHLQQGAYDQVRSLIREGVALAREMAAVPYQLHAILTAAHLYLKTGEPEQAVLWTALVEAHPACNEELRQEVARMRQAILALPDGEALLNSAGKQDFGLDVDLVLDMIEVML